MVHKCPDCGETCYCDGDDSNDADPGICFHLDGTCFNETAEDEEDG